jgi:HK97 gp10 family phage protein
MGIRLEGMEHLIQRIQDMGKRLDERTEKEALKAGAEFLQEKVKETLEVNKHVRTGTLKNEIIVSDVKNGEIHIGPDQQGTAFYGHILEFGRKAGKSNGYKYPAMPPYPFMGPTFENNRIEAQSKMIEKITERLDL